MAFLQECHNLDSGHTLATIAAQFTTANLSAGSTIVVFVTGSNLAATATCADDAGGGAGHTYLPIDNTSLAGQGALYGFYVPVTLGVGTKPTITVTWSPAVDFRDLAVLEYSALGALDKHANNASSSFPTSANGVTCGPVTPTTDGQLIVAGIWNGNAVNVTMSAGTSPNAFTQRVNQGNTGTDTTQLVQDFLQTTAASISSTSTASDGHELIVLGTFAAAGGDTLMAQACL